MTLPNNLRAVHPSCRSSYREDRRHGLIYGPYGLQQTDGNYKLVSGWKFAAVDGTCLYCGMDLSRQQLVSLRHFAKKRG